MKTVLSNVPVNEIIGIETIEYNQPSKVYLISKRLLDIIFSAILIVLLFPLFIVIAIIIKAEDNGPVIHNRMCISADGSEYKMFKFRSMQPDADKLEKWLSKDEIIQFYSEAKVDNDPRITKVGKFLRKYSLDELPQLFDIFLGYMSFVGPRPITKEESVHYGDKLSMLLEATPGLTGYWQVNGRSETTYKSGVRQGLELFYVANRCMSLDIKIFLKTFKVVILKEGAR